MKTVPTIVARAASLLVLTLTLTGAARAAAPAVEPPPAVLTVFLDFVASDARGRPLLSLATDEVVVTQDGARQTISALVPHSTPGRYELEYAPLLGKAGAVTLKVLRPGSQVRGAEGPALTPRVVCPPSPLEAELAHLLETRPAADDFPMQASIFRYEATAKGLHHTLAVEVPLSSLRIGRAEGQLAGHVQILTRLKDADGRVIHRFPLDHVLTVASAAEVQTQRLVWTGQVHLRRGRYALEVIARDPGASVASVRRLEFDAPEVQAGVRIGSVALLQPAGGPVLRDGSQDDDPFVLDGRPLMPTLAVQTVAASAARVEFFTIIYPDRNDPEPLVARLDLMRDGAIVGSARMSVGPADAKGEVRYTGALPVKTLTPGVYRIRLNAQQGYAVSFEEAAFTVVDGSTTAPIRLTEGRPSNVPAVRREPGTPPSESAALVADLERLLRRQEYGKALAAARKADKEANGTRGDVKLLIASIYLRMGAFNDASAQAKLAMASGADDPTLLTEAHMILARAATLSEKKTVRPDSPALVAAEAAYAKALELSQQGLENAHLERAQVLYRLGRPDDARAALDALLARADVTDLSAMRARQLKTNPRCASEACLPDLSFVTADGNHVTADELRGKAVLLSFWATWCGPCVTALPELKRLHARYENDPFVMVGVNLDHDREVMSEFMKKNDLRWPQIADGAQSLETALSVRGIPAEVIFDHEGVLVARTRGWGRETGRELDAHVRSAISRAKAARKTAVAAP